MSGWLGTLAVLFAMKNPKKIIFKCSKDRKCHNMHGSEPITYRIINFNSVQKCRTKGVQLCKYLKFAHNQQAIISKVLRWEQASSHALPVTRTTYTSPNTERHLSPFLLPVRICTLSAEKERFPTLLFNKHVSAWEMQPAFTCSLYFHHFHRMSVLPFNLRLCIRSSWI